MQTILKNYVKNNFVISVHKNNQTNKNIKQANQKNLPCFHLLKGIHD